MLRPASSDVADTVASKLARAAAQLERADVEDARLEAEALLAHALRVDRAHLFAGLADPVADAPLELFDALVTRRLAREPLAFITGVREFYGIEIGCSPAALIPRPETELLVDIALAAIRDRGDAASVADIGTGTGAIAIAIAANAVSHRLTATDVSPDAIDLAGRNAARIGVADRIEFRRADLLDGSRTFDVIVANLPYVSERDWTLLAPEIRDHEPPLALVGGDRGTEIIERLLDQAPAHLAPRGVLAVELDPIQAQQLLSRARGLFADARCFIEKDLAGHDRALVVRAP